MVLQTCVFTSAEVVWRTLSKFLVVTEEFVYVAEMNAISDETDGANPIEEPPKKNSREELKFKRSQAVPQYGDKLLQRLNEFRKKNMFYDVTLKTADGDLAAHKVVLAACGGMFRFV